MYLIIILYEYVSFFVLSLVKNLKYISYTVSGHIEMKNDENTNIID